MSLAHSEMVPRDLVSMAPMGDCCPMMQQLCSLIRPQAVRAKVCSSPQLSEQRLGLGVWYTTLADVIRLFLESWAASKGTQTILGKLP